MGRLYKLISPTLIVEFQDYWIEDGMVYTNAEARAKAVASGEWHPLTINPAPETDGYLIKRYHLEGDTIVLDWDVMNIVGGGDAEV